jgi:glyoxalase superfamily protein
MRPTLGQLAHSYERLLGWEMRALNGPRPGMPPGDGWAQRLSPDGSLKIEIQFDQHHVRPVWPGVAGAQGMQRHLDFRVEDVPVGVEWAIACGATQACLRSGPHRSRGPQGMANERRLSCDTCYQSEAHAHRHSRCAGCAREPRRARCRTRPPGSRVPRWTAGPRHLVWPGRPADGDRLFVCFSCG